MVQDLVSEGVVQAGTNQEAHALCVQPLQVVALCHARQRLSRFSCMHMDSATKSFQTPYCPA